MVCSRQRLANDLLMWIIREMIVCAAVIGQTARHTRLVLYLLNF